MLMMLMKRVSNLYPLELQLLAVLDQLLRLRLVVYLLLLSLPVLGMSSIYCTHPHHCLDRYLSKVL